MKKTFLLMAATLLALMTSAEVKYPYLKLHTDTFYTINAYNDKGEFVKYEGEGFRAGHQQWITAFLITKSELPNPLNISDTADYKLDRVIRFTDKDGNTERELVSHITQPLMSWVNSMKYSSQPQSMHDITTAIDMERGGEYTVDLFLTNSNISHTFDTIFRDYPSIRTYNQAKDTKVGTPVKMQIRYNTGYPYNPASYADGLYGQATLTDTAFNEIKKVRKDLTIKTHPLNKRAVIDTLFFEHAGLQPGPYRLLLETNWSLSAQARLKDTLLLLVNDTLRVQASVNKTVLANNEQLELNFSLNRGYPYIHTEDTVAHHPYVRVTAALADTVWENGIVKDVQSLLEDTIKVMHDSLHTKTLNYTGTLHFDLSKLPAKNLGHNLPLSMEVFFDDNSAFRRTFNVMVSNATALPSNKEEAPKARKIIRNGQILILRGSHIYDGQGKLIK